MTTGKEWISGQLLENRIKSIQGEFKNLFKIVLQIVLLIEKKRRCCLLAR